MGAKFNYSLLLNHTLIITNLFSYFVHLLLLLFNCFDRIKIRLSFILLSELSEKVSEVSLFDFILFCLTCFNHKLFAYLSVFLPKIFN